MMKIKKGLIAKDKKFIKENKWYHQRFDGCPQFLLVISEAELTKEKRKFSWGHALTHWGYFENDKCDWYIDMRDIKRITGKFIELSKKDSLLSKKIIKKWDNDEIEFYRYCLKVHNTDLRKLSDLELKKIYLEMLQKSIIAVTSSSIIDGFALGTDNYILEALRKFLTAKGLERQLQRYFAILTSPVYQSFMAEAEIWLLKIGKKIKANPKLYAIIRNSNLSEIEKKIKQSPVLYKELEKYQQKHFWTMNNYVDNNYLTVNYFLKELVGLMKGNVDLDAEINRLSKTVPRNKKAKSALLKELKLPTELKNLFTISEDFTKWQDERKKKTYWYAHYLSLILKEMGRRFDFSLHELKYFNYPEILGLFDKKNRCKVTRQEAKNRIKFCTWYQKGNLFEQFSGSVAVRLKNEFLSSKKEKRVNDFRGMSASKGIAQGRAVIIKSVKDCGKVKKGNVLVAVMTRPDYVPAMKKAVAIVTNEGGVTCHAAIISRELGIPCVIGTKIATEVLKDGNVVEVNANHGVVKIIK